MPTRRIVAPVILALLLVGCESQPRASTSPAPTSTSAESGSTTPLSPGDWPTYHHDAARTAVDPTAPATTAHARRWSTPVSGSVYAEPLAVGDRVLVATENDTVVALEARTGRQLWTRSVGQPVPGGDLPCGDIDPSGITGTPVIDAAARTAWVVAFVQPARHVLFGLDLANGAVRAQRVVDPPGSDSHVEQQRGALTLTAGRVYVPMGGLFGDCGDFHGYVVGVDSHNPPGPLLVYQVPSQREGGIWAPPGAALSADGSLLVASGNGSSTTAYDGGNSVLRLSPELRPLDSFTPTDSPQLNGEDSDLGSTGPLLVGGGLVFQIGKAGIGYLLRADHLGGVGGQAYSARACEGVLGAAVYSAPLILVPCEDGMVALRTAAGPSFSVAWRAGGLTTGPPIIAGGTVWALETSAGDVVSLDASTGAVRARVHVGRSNRFTTPASGGGQLYVAAGGQLVALAE